MSTVYTEEEFLKAKYFDFLKLKCDQCSSIFNRIKKYILTSQKRSQKQFCSKRCAFNYRMKRLEYRCIHCSTSVVRVDSAVVDVSRVFCSHSCAAIFSNKKWNVNCVVCGVSEKLSGSKHQTCSLSCTKRLKRELYISKWKNREVTGMCKTFGITPTVREYIFVKFSYKCCMSDCGWSKINPTTGKIPLHIDHIDGNFKNSYEDNLRLLCPNCHSLTPNYGSLNRGYGRPDRRLR